MRKALAEGDTNAALATLNAALMDGAAAISRAELCQGYLQNVPYHREVVAAWAREGPTG